MEYMCPVCNGFTNTEIACKQCGSMLEDKGKIIDYFDDYSPYVEIEGMKKIDGLKNDFTDHLCPHLLYCKTCHAHSTFLVAEI